MLYTKMIALTDMVEQLGCIWVRQFTYDKMAYITCGKD